MFWSKVPFVCVVALALSIIQMFRRWIHHLVEVFVHYTTIEWMKITKLVVNMDDRLC